MALSQVKFMVLFFLISVIGWFVFIFAARLLAWFLSRIMGASVGFRVAGWNCLRDVVVKFKKGAVESVCIGEIKLSLRQSLVKLGVGFISRDPKLQLLICDIEVVIRPSTKGPKKPSKSKSSKPRSAGRGKWMIVANMARFLSISVTELAIKMPKFTTEIKDTRVDISKDGGSKPKLLVKLHFLPIHVHNGESRCSYDQSSSFNHPEQASLPVVERDSALFICEEFTLSIEIGHHREVGVGISNVDVTSGEITLNLSEDLFIKNKTAPETPFQEDSVGGTTLSQEAAIKPQKKQSTPLTLGKYTSVLPEKVSFDLPKLNARFFHRGQGLLVENNVMGVHLRSSKSQSNEEMGESARFDVQMDFSEIHLLRDGGSSVLEILRLAVVSSVYVPLQPATPVRAEIDVKLGGTQLNIIISRLLPWMRLNASKKKKMALRDESSNVDKRKATESKVVMWTCTVSAPEMTIALYSISGLPLYHVCSQSSHLFANNIASTGTAVHMELIELHMHMADEYQEGLKESLFGMETNSGSLMHVAKVGLDWGKKEIESVDEHGTGRCKLVLSVDVTGMGVYFSFRQVESLISTAMSFQALFKSLRAPGTKATRNKAARSSKPSGKGAQFLKLNLERCSINFFGDVGVDDAVIPDPKRVNYGSQGGRVVIDVCADGSPRTAKITSALSNGCKQLRYSVSLDIFHLSLCTNKEKQSTQVELERARSIYHEYLEEDKPHTKVTLFDMRNAKFVRRSGGVNEIAVCSLFSATDILVRWEPDLHLSLIELSLRMKSLIHKVKLRGPDNENKEELSSGKIVEPEKNASVDSVQTEKQHKKRESVFAIDVEMLNISAEVGDGVNAVVQVQSIFSENARIGVLLEGLTLSFNEARVFNSTRMQISRIPNSSMSSQTVTTWDWVIRGLDVHICMPFRLQLRAIEDAVEDMMRGLKIMTAAKTSIIFPKKESHKPKKPSSTKFGSVRFCIRKLTFDIEEEPLQGWLDEHYQLLKNEARELAVRLQFLDDITSEGIQGSESAEPNTSCSAKKYCHNGVEIDLHDTSAVQNLREEIYKNTFQSYYQACQKLVGSEGSGAYKRDFQAGFRLSTARTSVLSAFATELDVTLTEIEGGETGMIEVVKKLDPVALENEIPFSRLLGRNIVLNTGSLTAQLRNYTFPLFSGKSGKCEGRVVLAQQATSFQPQISQDVFIGRWRKVSMLRSLSGTTPPMKTYLDLPLHFQKADVCFGVGFEPVFADISFAFTVALRRANLSIRNPNPNETQPPKKEKSLPWWDEIRNYLHGNTTLSFSETTWRILGTTDPYEKIDKLKLLTAYMEIQQSDGRVYVSAKDFKIFLSSLESLVNNSSSKLPNGIPYPFLVAPTFTLEVTMDWECDSGNPLDHYLWALPVEGQAREKVYDPFRSTSLSLRWNFSLRPSLSECETQSSSLAEENVLDGVVNPSPHKAEHVQVDSPTVNVGAHDLAWLVKFWNINYLPPHKLRSFSRWPRFGVPRIARSGNLSMDRVMTEFMLRIDAMPTCIKHMSLDDEDPASGLTFKMSRLKTELGYSRGKQKFTFDCKRDPLDLVYQGIDLHVLKIYLDEESKCAAKEVLMARKSSPSMSMDRISIDKGKYTGGCSEKNRDDGFLLASDYFTIRKQAPKADPTRLLAWQEAGKKNAEMTYVRSEFENGSDSDGQTRSDPSDDDGFNVVIADNCQRVFVYGLKLLWTIENRDAVWSFAGGLSKAFQPPKPSPSWQYAQRKLLAEKQLVDGAVALQDENSHPSTSVSQDASSDSPKHVDASESLPFPSTPVKMKTPATTEIPAKTETPAKMETTPAKTETPPKTDTPAKTETSSSVAVSKTENMDDSEEEGTRHFMVNVIQPQFNLHSEEANGRFLLAAASGRILARSFHSVLHVGYDMIEKALGAGSINIPECDPEMTWKRAEFSVMLEQVQAHVAPTDVDPGAGLQWLPKILRSSPKVKRTGALLERVFMPCTMYFRYTRHKGGTPELKVKPLKELTFNSPNITATMTSRQFQVMLDVLTNLLFARLPKPRKSSNNAENDEDVEEEADEVVPDGVEEVELARISVEQKERERKLLLADIRNLPLSVDVGGSAGLSPEMDASLWMVNGGRSVLVQGLKTELENAQKSKKVASASLRMALQKAAQLRLMEKEKNKSPSYAMRISLKINKVVWGMLADGKSFAEAEINNMIYDFDRDYKDVGVAKFTTKYFVVRNCLPNAKSDMLLSAWNPPSEWGKNVMLRVDARQGAPNVGNSPLELFQVVIYPLKIHLTETMYRMMWGYFFPEEEQDSQRRQQTWKFSTTAGSKRVKKGGSTNEATVSGSSREFEVRAKSAAVPLSVHSDTSQASKLQNLKANAVSAPELRRTSSFDRTWEESVAETVANELMLHIHSKGGSLSFTPEQQEEFLKNKLKDSKPVKPGRPSQDEKKVVKPQDEKRTRARRLREFHNIKISQVELLVTYEGSRFAVSDLRLLMDSFHRDEFTGTWRKLFSRVKKHIIWGVLKSVTGMQGKKFKDKASSQREPTATTIPDGDFNFSDSDEGQGGKSDQYPISFLKRPNDGAGDGFVTSIRGLFNSQRRKAKAFVLRTMRGEADNNEFNGDWSESDIEFSPYARQLTINKARKLIRRHTKKFRSRGQKGSSSQQKGSLPSSPRESTGFESDCSSGLDPYEDLHGRETP